MKLPMSNRLLAVCSYIRPGDRVADIGCDHGYLGIYLLTRGIASSTIESDVAQGPLDSARSNARKFGVAEEMTFCLGPGVQAVPRDFDALVCAGMGGDTIQGILEEAPWLADPKYRLVLQCQSKRPELRRWLFTHGWRILRETLAKDGKFLYPVMEVVYDPVEGFDPVDAYVTPQLLRDASPLLPEFLARVRRGVGQSLLGLRQSRSPELPKLEEIYEKLQKLEENVHGDRG